MHITEIPVGQLIDVEPQLLEVLDSRSHHHAVLTLQAAIRLVELFSKRVDGIRALPLRSQRAIGIRQREVLRHGATVKEDLDEVVKLVEDLRFLEDNLDRTQARRIAGDNVGVRQRDGVFCLDDERAVMPRHRVLPIHGRCRLRYWSQPVRAKHPQANHAPVVVALFLNNGKASDCGHHGQERDKAASALTRVRSCQQLLQFVIWRVF